MSLVTYEFFHIETLEVAVCNRHRVAMCSECLVKQLKSMEAQILELQPGLYTSNKARAKVAAWACLTSRGV